MKKATMPAFVLALFPPEEPAGGGGTGTSTQNNDGGGAGGNGNGGGNGAQVPAQQHRDDHGRYESVAQAEARITQLNEENKSRRQENASLKKSVDAIATRTIRGEAKAALLEAGALHPDVVDVFLKSAGDKVKLNDEFDVVGIGESLESFKKSHAAFFKAAEGGGDEAKAGEGKKDGDKKDGEKKDGEQKNATAAGASAQGGGGSGEGAKNVLPDLRKLTPEERKKALDEYEKNNRRR